MYSPEPLIVTVSYDGTAPLGRQWLAECGGGEALLSAAAYSPHSALINLAMTLTHNPVAYETLTTYKHTQP